MLKKRIIFTLLVEDGYFVLSRNFTLQKVGDLEWLKDFYDFDSIAFSIDELLVLDVSRGERNKNQFASLLGDISKNCFMPIGAGGGISSVEDVSFLLNSGADKVVINTIIFTNPNLVRDLVERFGAQCIVASIDYKTMDTGEMEVFIKNGYLSVGVNVKEALAHVQELGVGEIYLTSINRDGTGRGFDLDGLSSIISDITCPLIVSGGAGTFGHIADAIKEPGVSAVSTANLFNFMSDNLTEARQCVVGGGTPLAEWLRPFPVSR